MSHSLNTLKKGVYRGLCKGLLWGLLRGILGVETMAHIGSVLQSPSNRHDTTRRLKIAIESYAEAHHPCEP